MQEAFEKKRDISDMDHDFLSDAILPGTQHVDEASETITEHEDNIDSDEEVLDEVFEELNVSISNIKKDEIEEQSCEQGIIHMAAAIASNFRDDNLGITEIKSKFPSQMFTSTVNKGGLLKLTDQWLVDVKKMDKMFMEYHPKDRLLKGPCLTQDFTKNFKCPLIKMWKY